MPKINFKLSDNQKYEMLWSLLNPEFDEEHDYAVDYIICDVYDQYAVARNLTNGQFERVFYEKNDEADSLSITGNEVCYIVDVNQGERDALNALNKLNDNTFEKIDEKFEQMQEENSNFATKIEEHEATIATLQEENENIANEFNQAKEQYTASLEQIENLTAANEELANYKAKIEKAEKEGVINQYADKLDEAKIEEFTQKIDEMTREDLEKELAFALVNSNPSLFTNDNGFIPKDEPQGGIAEILSRY